MMIDARASRNMNALGLFAVCGVLIAAYAMHRVTLPIT